MIYHITTPRPLNCTGHASLLNDIIVFISAKEMHYEIDMKKKFIYM